MNCLDEKKRKILQQQQQQQQLQSKQQQQQQPQTDVFDFLNTTCGITYLESESTVFKKDNFIQSILSDSNVNSSNSTDKKKEERNNNGMNILKIEDSEIKLKQKLVCCLLLSLLLFIDLFISLIND